jgi:membrane protease YdiL (CAAX protease family)
VAIVLITSLFFGAVHFPEQGLAGAEQATIAGIVYGAILLATGRLWLPMIMHAAFDLAALVIIYADLETKVAHFVFR